MSWQRVLTKERFDSNQRVATRLQEVVSRMRPSIRNLRFVKTVFDYLVNTPTGYYASDAIDRFYLGLARLNAGSISTSYEKDTCLLVTHSISGTGGHSRVMERWIEADKKRRYSIALLVEDDGKVDPQLRIVKAVENSGGTIFTVRGGNVVERGYSLRQSASEFEFVVLFTFPWDVEHVVAFGSDKFMRPVGYYNAPDHMFWIGSSVIDVCADIRRWGKRLTAERRGIDDSMLLPVPASKRMIPNVSKEDARIRLGLSQEQKIIVTAARYVKFIPISDTEDYTTIVGGVLDADENVCVICIGARKDSFNDWSAVAKKWGDRFVLRDYVPHEELLLFFKAADIVVDSYPFSGIATLEDAVCCGTPILSTSDRIDFLVDSPAYVPQGEDFVSEALHLISDKKYALMHADKTRSQMLEEAGEDSFCKGIDAFFGKLSQSRHRIRDFVAKPSGLTLCEKVRMHEAYGYSLHGDDAIIARIGLIRPILLSKLLYRFLPVFSSRKLRSSIRIALYPIVLATRSWRRKKWGLLT